MKKNFRNFSLMASVCLLSFGVASCSNEYKAPAMRLSDSLLNMNVGETKHINISIDKNFMNAPVRWFTTNENVAFFRDPSVGYVTAIGEGEATVTASVAGSYADCKIVVTSTGGDPEAARFTLQGSATVNAGETVKLAYSVNPTGSTVTFTSLNEAVAAVDGSGVVTGLAAGTATISAECSNGITKQCIVTVTESGDDPVDPSELDIGLPDTVTGLSGSIVVGASDKAHDTVQYLINQFNVKTNSNVSFTIKPYEDGDGVANFPNGAESGPDVFPFVSDQTMNLDNKGCLAPLYKSDYQKYKTTMSSDAIQAATWNENVLGYPFAADNGIVMFYDSSVVNTPERKAKLDTLDGLFELCQETGKKLAYNVTNGFYAASLLHTYNKGESMFSITATSTSYECSSTFAGVNGRKAMELAYKIMMKGESGQWTSLTAAPGSEGILATIVDTSNVKEYKGSMGSRYAVAPTPKVEGDTRLCTYLGYKFYGVNASIKDNSKKTLAHYVAKFLTSEFAQDYRFKVEQSQPTLKSLQSICTAEPHINAINQQKGSGATLLLNVFGDEYFNNTALCLTKLLNNFVADDEVPSEADYMSLLEDLDGSWGV